MDGLSEEKLSKLAEDLGNDPDVPKVAQALGFKKVKIDQYMATNRLDGFVGHKGTANMLFDWKKGTVKKDQVPNMKEALEKGGFRELAMEYCGEKEAISLGTRGPRDDQAPSNAMWVTDAQLLKLSQLLHVSFYDKLAAYLGFSFAEYDNIKRQHLLDMPHATLQILQKWNVKTGGKQSDLDEALCKAECGGLIVKYKEA